jgi:predicted metal-dependent hydrolase
VAAKFCSGAALMALRRPADLNGSIEYAGREIAFTVEFGRRRNMYITVNPDCSVEVRAPRRAGMADVTGFVQSRGRWILDHIARFESLSPVLLDRPYTDGARHMYHGDEIELAVEPGLFDSVEFTRGTLRVATPDWHDAERVGDLVEHWFLDRALEYLPPRMEQWFERAAPVLGVGYPELRIGYMKRCWGTSSQRGWVHLNSELIKITPECADYVIVHELCHLRERGHNKRFYGLVAEIMGDWRRRSRRLERYVIV